MTEKRATTLGIATKKVASNKVTRIIEVGERASNILVKQEVDFKYPYCELPPHYFERKLAQGEVGRKAVLSIEPWTAVSGEKSFGVQSPD